MLWKDLVLYQRPTIFLPAPKDRLEILGRRVPVKVVKGEVGGDPVAYLPAFRGGGGAEGGDGTGDVGAGDKAVRRAA